MSNEVVGIIGIVLMLVLLFMRMWIGLAMAIVGFLGYAYLSGFQQAFVVAGTVPFKQVASYSFSSIPMFTLMGMMIFYAGMAKDLFYAAYKWMGRLPGGLAISSAVASAILGVVTDSMIAVVTLGKSAMPEMKKYNYDTGLATGSIIAGASLASLIPPSVSFILYGIITENSIGELFIAAIIPGILMTVLIVGLIIYRAIRNPGLAPLGPRTIFREKLESLKYVWAFALLLLLVIGGIYFGIFTPTEAGAIGSFGAIVIAILNRRFNRHMLINSLLETAKITAMVVILMTGTFIFMKFLAISHLSFSLSDFIVSLALPKYAVFFVVVILYLIFGMFMDVITCILLTMPVIYPIMIALGFDPIWYGVIIVILIEMGLMTPPVGMNVFVLSGISGVPSGTIFKGILPFIAIILVGIFIMTVFPQIVLFLPGMM